MSGSDDRVEEALAAHVEHLEMGGPDPDLSHLNPAELERLQSLIGLLDQTEGIAFGRGLGDAGTVGTAETEAGAVLVAVLHEALPAAVHIANDPAATTIGVPGMSVAEGWIVGTFGGRIRVWLLDEGVALEGSEEWLQSLARVFRVFPDTAALALVDPGLSCLLVQPEDCAPAIEVPRGSLIARRYRRPILPVAEALSVFLRELTPQWEPMQDLDEQATSITIDVAPVARERATHAIQEQVAAGGRARKTNPKRKALTDLGEKESSDLAALVLAVGEGRLRPDGVEEELRRLAAIR